MIYFKLKISLKNIPIQLRTTTATLFPIDNFILIEMNMNDIIFFLNRSF